MEEIVVDGNRVVAKGYFPPFQWKDITIEAMQFTTWLYFNDEMKITRHIDGINYPASLVDYESRKNSNNWIEESQKSSNLP